METHSYYLCTPRCEGHGIGRESSLGERSGGGGGAPLPGGKCGKAVARRTRARARSDVGKRLRRFRRPTPWTEPARRGACATPQPVRRRRGQIHAVRIALVLMGSACKDAAFESSTF